MAKILIVDDQRSVLLTLEAVLKSQSHQVVACTNAEEAWDCLQREEFDLVVTDAIMPGGSDGYELTRQIRQHPVFGKMPVVLLTGKREKSDIEKGIQAKVSDYVVKPMDPELFLVKIEKLLSTNSRSSAEFAEVSVSFSGEWESGSVVQTISELGLQIQSQVSIPVGKIVKFRTELFAEIGIDPVPLRIDSCSAIPGTESLYRIQAHFVGITEKELTPIRLWIRHKKI